MTTSRDHLQIILSDHASIADEDQPAEPEPPVQVGHGLLDRGVVDLVTRPDVMRDRPARDHHHRDDHLDILRLAIPAVAVLGEIGRPGALEVGAGDVVEHQLGLEAEQIAEAVIEGQLDLFLGGCELIEGAVPGLELLKMNPDPLVLVPARHKPPPLTVADEIGLQPAGQAVFAGGTDQAIGDQHERPVGERHALGLAQSCIEDSPEPELIEQGPDDQERPPGGGVEDVGVIGLGAVRAVPAEQPLELGEDLDQKVLAAEVGEGALLDLAAVAIGLDDADILVDSAAGGANFDGSQVHVVKYHDARR